MANDNITPVDFGGKDSMQSALEELKRNTDAMIEYAIIMAKIRRQSYLACMEQGFSEVQALDLCKDI